MNASQKLLVDKSWISRTVLPDRSRLFYSAAALLMLVLMMFGFQQFYLHGRAYPGRELTPPIRTLLIFHGAGMAAWMLLFLIQPLLIFAGNRRVHMMFGRIGATLAACIVVLGLKLGIDSTLVNPPDLKIWGFSPKQFLAVPILSMTAFAGFVWVGIWNRRRPEVHRPMMLLATLIALPAAVSRIDAISALYLGTVWETIFGPFFGTLVIGMGLLIIKYLLTRSINRWFAMGYAGLVGICALIIQLAPTSAWDRFAGFLLQ
jgi:hypothetical protein